MLPTTFSHPHIIAHAPIAQVICQITSHVNAVAKEQKFFTDQKQTIFAFVRGSVRGGRAVGVTMVVT